MSTDNPFFRKWLSKLSATDLTLGSVKEVAILGELSEPGIQALIGRVRQKYRPNLALAASPLPVPTGSPALLDDRPMQAGRPTAYVCTNFVCNLPVTQPEQLAHQL